VQRRLNPAARACPGGLQWRKGVALDASLKLLDDIAAVSDMPAKVEAAVARKVRQLGGAHSTLVNSPCLRLQHP
jgi:hypothetical protein